ncbi:MAG: hypothetical protein AAGB12_00820 [Pseudomonadota bacterium]
MMIKRTTTLTMFFTCILLMQVSCSFLPKKHDLKTHYQQLLQQNQYLRAEKYLLEKIGQIDQEEDKNYWSKAQSHLQVKKMEYYKQSLSQAKKLWKKRSYYYAVNTLQTLEKNVGKTREVSQLLKKYDHSLKQRQNIIKVEQVLNDGKHLVRDIDLHNQSDNLLSKEDFREKREHLENQRLKTAEHLFHLSQQLLATKKRKKAIQLLEVGKQLKDKRSEALLSSINISQDIERRKMAQRKAKAKESKRRAQIEKLFTQAENAINAQSFIEAQEHISALHRKSLENPSRLLSIEQHLKQLITQRISNLYKNGKSYYSSGAYEAALNAWESILLLDPNHNEANQLKKRTQRVIKNLSKLSQPPLAVGE